MQEYKFALQRTPETLSKPRIVDRYFTLEDANKAKDAKEKADPMSSYDVVPLNQQN